MDTNLASAMAASAAKHQHKTAVYWGNDDYSYAWILQESTTLAHQLRQRYRLKSNDRVGIWLKNRPEYFPVIFGVLEAGGVAVPINHFLKPQEVSYILADAGIDVLITEESLKEAVSQLAAERPQLGVLNVDEPVPLQDAIPATPAPPRTESDLAFIIYTSGTTGRPKGAMLTHGNLLHNVESCRQVLAAVDHDRFVLLLPMFHSFMLCVCILLPVMVGGSVVLVRSLNTPKAIIQEIMARQPTILPAIPQFFRALTDPSVPPQLPLRLCVSGAAPLPVQILRDFNQRFTIPLLEGYGLSEASPVVSINPIHGPWKAGSIGRPIPNVEVRIRHEEGRWLPPGEIGELCVRGGNVMQGYWNQPEASAEALKDGWLLTGDIGYEDTDGYFYITDRKKDMLLVNGINVYPREIEEVIYTFPSVKEAAVVGRPDARKGEQPVAFICTHTGNTLDEKDLIQYLRGKLADYKIPRQYVHLPALPRNDTGKILKTALRRQLEGEGKES